MSIKSVADFVHMDAHKLRSYYRDHLSGFHRWNQKRHASDWVLFGDNLGDHLAIDETSLSDGELYTVLTNKDGRGGRGTLVAMVRGVASEDVTKCLLRLPEGRRRKVKSITMDMSGSMYKIARTCFPNAEQVIDRFHVQKLMYDALQELRVEYRWMAIKDENGRMAEARDKNEEYKPEVLPNGDTYRQLLARSRYLLFKSPGDWTPKQKERAEILFGLFEDIKTFYFLAQHLGYIYYKYDDKSVAMAKMALWFNKVEEQNYPQFDTVVKTFKNHYDRILNYFNNRQTNASAEAFNRKLKSFRGEFRGVNDIDFYMYRIKNLYA